MGFYLVDHPPSRSQFRTSRRAAERGVVVVHTAESTPDYVAFDGGAEAVANFIRTRTDVGSYHELADSDSSVPMVPDHSEAFGDGTGSNPWAWHLSVATRADVWPLAPPSWRDGAVEQAAQAAAGYAHRLHARTGIVIPARRITRAESEAGVPGFVSHGDRDPGRRHDPGDGFPWDAFLARYADLTADLNDPPAPLPSEEDDMPKVYDITDEHPDKAASWLVVGNVRYQIPNPSYREAAVAVWGEQYVSAAAWDLLRSVTSLGITPLIDADGHDPAEIARLVLAELDEVAMSSAQVQAIIDAIPAQVKRALREGTD